MVHLPSLRQLRHLAALAEHRHFGRAAAACGITQSTLSASLKELEELLQAPLVDRTQRKMVLTPLGAEVVARGQAILRDAEELVRTTEGHRAPLSGTVRLGVIPTIGPFLLPRILPRLRKAYPKLKLYLTEDQTARLLDDLGAGRLDAVVLALPYDCGNVETATLFDDPFSIVMRRDHELAKSPQLPAHALDREALLLLRDGHCLKDHALSACRLDGRRHVDAFEATSLHTLVQMVDNGLGVTLLPRLALDAHILKGTDLVAKPLASNAPSREIALVWRRGTGRRAEFELLARTIVDLARKTGPAGAAQRQS
jgi:LysR family hydrogen peroxide-inducible transcriptional activator